MESSNLAQTRPSVARVRESVDRYSEQGSSEFISRQRAKWEVCSSVIDHLYTQLEENPSAFDTRELWPALPIAISNFVVGLHGFAIPETPIEATALTEALMERLSQSPHSSPAGRFAMDREFVSA